MIEMAKKKEKNIIGFELEKEYKLIDISDEIIKICEEDIKRAKEEMENEEE
ncbi:unnamed protein product [marine sediment metagenome]|uniref:Uncharacterized protein n=1 Tax=marine sediment metagenome TaxID=412755 RepID=X1U4K0_9ZZZZ